jgi:hypothetical protein
MYNFCQYGIIDLNKGDYMLETKIIKGKEVKKFKPSPLAIKVAHLARDEWDTQDLDWIIESVKLHKMHVQHEYLMRSYNNAK